MIETLLYMKILLMLHLFGVALPILGLPQPEPLKYHYPPEVAIPLKLSGTDRRMKIPGWISYSLHIEGQRYIVHMKAKKNLIARNLPVFTYTDQGILHEEHPYVQSNCYYYGFVEGDPDSLVAMSNCTGGFQGMLETNNITYEIMPITSSTTFQHWVFKLYSEETANVSKSDIMSDKIPPSMELQEMAKSTLSQHLPTYEGWWVHYRTVEYAMVADNSIYIRFAMNESMLMKELFAVSNIVDTVFAPLGIDVLMCGLEIWTEKNPFTTYNGAQSLKLFCRWKMIHITPRIPHDTAHLFINNHLRGLSGLAPVKSMCNPPWSCAIVTFIDRTTTLFAIALCHHIGHNLGMEHDSPTCKCGHLKCLMHEDNPPTPKFSTCSYHAFFTYVERNARCLMETTHMKDIFTLERCGNGIVEPEEACDCGLLQGCEKDPCCMPNCTLSYGANCAFGLCCSKECKFLPSGKICRKEVNLCDLPEWCNGTSHNCPDDVYVEDGIPCSQTSYCYAKECNDRNELCRDIFGSESKSADHICYKNMNVQGTRFGHCGLDGASYKKCNITDVLCGRVQCDNVSDLPMLTEHNTVHFANFNNITCWGTDFHPGLKILDIGAVKDGTECGMDHICIRRQCVHISVLDSNCSPSFCNMRGICNNKHHCHCNYLWDPPNCEIKGYGGSVDSGPPPKTKRKKRVCYLCILLLIILCILVCTLIYLCVKELSKKKERETRRSQSTKSFVSHHKPSVSRMSSVRSSRFSSIKSFR
ncbi:disintegrin and metalloproteinase domain-containing protein 29 [Perognathus longimembris pacificus]|uniref:disintegrin and metalloproteinase domain-containing protein 29 n=1 Tax=Perognathus longimembris pacificus TaxID=214514 RepID=UPI0020190BF3|nr:disintegrin and metalloproteinase domain-containing protein 29 [Perognathus longimembris pacificus]